MVMTTERRQRRVEQRRAQDIAMHVFLLDQHAGDSRALWLNLLAVHVLARNGGTNTLTRLVAKEI